MWTAFSGRWRMRSGRRPPNEQPGVDAVMGVDPISERIVSAKKWPMCARCYVTTAAATEAM
jgi:hypothetical protein